MLFTLVERFDLIGADDLAVDAQSNEAGALRLRDELAVFALAVHEQRGEKQHARPRRLLEQSRNDPIGGLPFDWALAPMAALPADAGVEDPKIVGDFRDRPHRGA